MMNALLRLGLALLLVATCAVPAAAAAKRYVTVVNNSNTLIDAFFLQPPSSTVTELYGTLHAKMQQKFTLNAGDTKIGIRSTACQRSTYEILPTRDNVTVLVENGCTITVR
jgi:hypothetical protein